MNAPRWAWTALLAIAPIAAQSQSFQTPPRASWTENASVTATITWDSLEAARGTVRWGASTNALQSLHDAGGLHRHAITLRGLAPGSRYVYEVFNDGVSAGAGAFRTAPTAGASLHFAVHGDLNGGVNTNAARDVANQIAAEDPQWVINLGDISDEGYGGAGFATWRDFFATCTAMIERAVFMPIVGNHDDPDAATGGGGHTRGLFHRLFALPEPSLGEGFYAFTAGNVRFVCLNSEHDLAIQTNWLARELQAAAFDTNLTWLISTYHRPPYSWGERDGWDPGRTNFSPVHVRYETPLVINGHSHNYQRTVPIRGVNYLVAGGAGGWPYDPGGYEPSHLFATSCFHHVSVHVTGDVLQLRGIRSDGLVFDTASLTNRRQVTVSPAFPRRGQPVTIRYRATEGPLKDASPVYLYIGQDAFSGAFADVPMTFNPTNARWEHTLVVPATASNRLAFVFHDAAGTNWHNNYAHDWQALLDRVQLDPAVPVAGSNLVVRYEADMGPLAGAGSVGLWAAWNRGAVAPTGYVGMTLVSGAVWQATLAVPAHAEELSLAFSNGSQVDDDYRRGWRTAVAGTHGWLPAPYVAEGSPVVSGKPPDGARNHAGDNMDLATPGPAVRAGVAAHGFGSWGSLWLNADATNLYLGAHGVDLGGSDNVFVLFLGLDTLTDDAWNLWHKSGPPNTLDFLHNVRFTEPMDVALVFGDQYGDRATYTNFTYEGYDFGQGVFYLRTNDSAFAVMSGAQLSQFDGYGTTPCVTTADAPHRQTMRWEARLPWSALGAAGPASASNLLLAGVVASASVQTNDRYLSRAVLGERAWGATDGYGQHGYSTVIVRPLRVDFLHADLRGDGISNGWRLARFGTPAGPAEEEDSDGDGLDTWSEFVADTDPVDPASGFAARTVGVGAGVLVLAWSNAPGRLYAIARSTNLFEAFQPLATNVSAGSYTGLVDAAGSSFYRLGVRLAP